MKENGFEFTGKDRDHILELLTALGITSPIEPPPPRPPEAPGWSEMRKDRQPSKTTFGGTPPIVCPNWLLRFIDWLNALFGVEKPKNKSKGTTEQMATLAELFEDVDDSQPPPPKHNPGGLIIRK